LQTWSQVLSQYQDMSGKQSMKISRWKMWNLLLVQCHNWIRW
jgi:hypothetical protein